MILVSARLGRATEEEEEDTCFLIKAAKREAFSRNCYSQF
jgi:hypothetical protein